ncbi:hypothetical protein LWI28_000754 [Acer negundo]|uniref:DUF4283 domain-containing protein n=1 Tax=Acer negundo TaxID=4023 RepID=A0AAD5J2H9_ACENE|nr:hypothetical protein LWI28_000754 [Acer negundo]
MALPSAGNTSHGDSLVQSYAHVVAKPMDNPSFKIPMRFSVDINGELGFIFSKPEMAKAAEDYKFAIVMKFMHARPLIDNIRLNIVKTWGLLEIPTISFMDDYHVLIQMKNERDFVHGWTHEGRTMEGISFRLVSEGRKVEGKHKEETKIWQLKNKIIRVKALGSKEGLEIEVKTILSDGKLQIIREDNKDNQSNVVIEGSSDEVPILGGAMI